MNWADCEAASKKRIGEGAGFEAARSRASAAHRGATRISAAKPAWREREVMGISFSGGRIGHPGRGETDAFESGPSSVDLRENSPVVAQALDPPADLVSARWRRAVDRLWREVLRRRQRQLTERARALAP